MDSREYRMSIDLNVLRHLGITLYSNVPAVISEAVANSWDADAENVDIKIVPGKSITIQDDGEGMSVDDANDRYLRIGYDRRKGSNRKTRKDRKVMGRKGIGKLSLFSIAKTIKIYSIKDGICHGFQMSIPDIMRSIEEEQKSYFPKPLPPDDTLKKGTKIVLTNLKPRFRRSPALKNRLARKFSIIGSEFNFTVRINGKEITAEDRGYQDKIEHAWSFGKWGDEVIGNAKTSSKLCSKVVYDGKHIGTIDGWIGAANKPSHLMAEGDNINKIVIMVRGKAAQEDILADFEEGGLYTKYLMGEIRADFLDKDEEDDIATTSRQRIIEDDPRYIALQKHVWECLKQVQKEWSKIKGDKGVDEAFQITAIKNWYDGLPSMYKDPAKNLFRRIGQLSFDDRQEYGRRQVFISGILAFESLKLRDMLDKLESIVDMNPAKFKEVFLQLDNLEASSYYIITKQRLEVIETLASIKDSNKKEDIIKKYIHKNLWIIDPSWRRIKGSERIESGIRKAFGNLDARLTKEEKGSRFDLKYARIDGKHVIIELKKPDRVINTFRLGEQIQKYNNALKKVLRESSNDTDQITFVCVLGKLPVGWDGSSEAERKSREALKVYDAQIVFYDQLIDNAQRTYQEYIDKKEEVNSVYDLIAEISSTDTKLMGISSTK